MLPKEEVESLKPGLGGGWQLIRQGLIKRRPSS